MFAETRPILRFMAMTAFLMLVGAASHAQGPSDVPDQNMSIYTWAHPGPGPLTLMIAPGGGDPLTQARTATGEVADASIELWLVNASNTPVPGFPREDLWLEWADDGQVFCPGGTIADQDTDTQGHTIWSAPLRGGGSSTALCQAYVAGSALVSSPGLQLQVNSPDLNGDLRVDLGDVPLFAMDYHAGTHPFRSDLEHDGRLDLSDVVRMVQALGAECP